MNIIDRLNEEVSIYDLFNISDPPVSYKTDKKPSQVSCPFHGQDNRPSARVYPDTNSFRCFYCSKSWSPVTFWAQINNWYKEEERLDIGRAISDLCTRYNISDQTFDWQKKFYRIKSDSQEEKKTALEERLLLADYYSWNVSKAIHKLSEDDRDSLSQAILNAWQDFDVIDLSSDSWEEHLKNWYSAAKITVNDAI